MKTTSRLCTTWPRSFSVIHTGIGRILLDAAIAHIRSVARGRKASVELNVNRNNPAVGFYQHLGLKVLRQGDFHIGNGFYMNDYIMGMEVIPLI